MPWLWSVFVDSLQRSPWGWALLGAVLAALIRIWPALSKQAMEERAAIRGESRSDLESCYDKVKALRAELDAFKALVTSYHIKLNGTLIAYRIIDVALAVEKPGCHQAVEARAVLRTAFGGSELPEDVAELLKMVS